MVSNRSGVATQDAEPPLPAQALIPILRQHDKPEPYAIQPFFDLGWAPAEIPYRADKLHPGPGVLATVTGSPATVKAGAGYTGAGDGKEAFEGVEEFLRDRATLTGSVGRILRAAGATSPQPEPRPGTARPSRDRRRPQGRGLDRVRPPQAGHGRFAAVVANRADGLRGSFVDFSRDRAHGQTGVTAADAANPTPVNGPGRTIYVRLAGTFRYPKKVNPAGSRRGSTGKRMIEAVRCRRRRTRCP